jgi:hypothetical protein
MWPRLQIGITVISVAVPEKNSSAAWAAGSQRRGW